MKKLIIALLTIFLMSGICCFAGDAELYRIINGDSYFLDAAGTEYELAFQGQDDVNFSGAAWLYWSDIIIVDGYRYPIRKKLLMPFSVWDGSIDIEVGDGHGNVTVFSFMLDYEMAITQACPDLRFFPAETGE